MAFGSADKLAFFIVEYLMPISTSIYLISIVAFLNFTLFDGDVKRIWQSNKTLFGALKCEQMHKRSIS